VSSLCYSTPKRIEGVSKNSILRSVAKYRQEGIDGFYRPRKGRGASVMTAEVISQAQNLLDSGYCRRDAAEELGIKYDTLRKAIDQGRLREPTPATEESQKPAISHPTVLPSDKSSRSDADASAAFEMGLAVSTLPRRFLRRCALCSASLGGERIVSPFEQLAGALGLLPEAARSRVVGLHGLMPHQGG
jgi:transposase